MSDINPELWERAEKLASRSYDVEIYEDTLSNGEIVYLVKNPELRGCMAQGDTLQDALKELTLARINYIYFKLLDGHPVAAPHAGQTITASGISASFTEFNMSGLSSKGGTLSMHQLDDFLNTVIQPDTRDKVASFSLIEGKLENQT